MGNLLHVALVTAARRAARDRRGRRPAPGLRRGRRAHHLSGLDRRRAARRGYAGIPTIILGPGRALARALAARVGAGRRDRRGGAALRRTALAFCAGVRGCRSSRARFRTLSSCSSRSSALARGGHALAAGRRVRRARGRRAEARRSRRPTGPCAAQPAGLGDVFLAYPRGLVATRLDRLLHLHHRRRVRRARRRPAPSTR